MKKPISKYSNSKQWKLYVVSISLQVWAFMINLFTSRKVTHGFYYSESQKEIAKEHLEVDMFIGTLRPKPVTNFGGKEYTEMRALEYGWCNWKDSKLVGLGSIADVRLDNECFK
jgi:hypothetical protein